jgi:hypothetical protein
MSKLNLTATPMEHNSYRVTKYGVTGNAPDKIMIQAVRAARWSFAPDSFKAECENRKMSNMKSKKSKNARTVPYSNPQATKVVKNAENPPGTSAMHANIQTSAINEKRQQNLQNQNVMNTIFSTNRVPQCTNSSTSGAYASRKSATWNTSKW